MGRRPSAGESDRHEARAPARRSATARVACCARSGPSGRARGCCASPPRRGARRANLSVALCGPSSWFLSLPPTSRLWPVRRRGVGPRPLDHPEDVGQGSPSRAVHVAAADLLPPDTEQDLGMHDGPKQVLEPMAGVGHLDHLAERHDREALDGGVEPHSAQRLPGPEPRESAVVRRDDDQQSIGALDRSQRGAVPQWPDPRPHDRSGYAGGGCGPPPRASRPDRSSRQTCCVRTPRPLLHPHPQVLTLNLHRPVDQVLEPQSRPMIEDGDGCGTETPGHRREPLQALVRDRPRREATSIRAPCVDGVQPAHGIHRDVCRSRPDPGQQVGITRVGQGVHDRRPPQGTRRDQGMVQGAATAHREIAPLGVGGLERTRPIGVQLQRVSVDRPRPGLSVVDAGSTAGDVHHATERKVPCCGCGCGCLLHALQFSPVATAHTASLSPAAVFAPQVRATLRS